jgi:hypothetical protein
MYKYTNRWLDEQNDRRQRRKKELDRKKLGTKQRAGEEGKNGELGTKQKTHKKKETKLKKVNEKRGVAVACSSCPVMRHTPGRDCALVCLAYTYLRCTCDSYPIT